MSSEDPDVGWCDWCEERLDTADEWTAELDADMRLVCTHCFANARERNERVPELARGRAVKLAAYLLGCEAVYRAPFDDLYWFMLLDDFRVSA